MCNVAPLVRLPSGLFIQIGQHACGCQERTNVSPSFLQAFEWQDSKTARSLVYLQLLEDKVIKVLDSKRTVVRSIGLENQEQVETILSNNRGYKSLLLKIPKEYDLVGYSGPK